MNQHRNPLASAISYALGAGMVAGMALTAAPVVAQQAEEAELDRIQVTGSRIQRTDVETTSPVLVIDREAILSSGLQNVGDVLRNLNQADSLGLSNLTSSTNANDGTQTISLRGLGAARTLVLVDGRRWLALGGGQVDVTQIPTSIIERVEVLGDGASAIYGSDAISGVINIILRDDFEGMEVDALYGESSEGDGETTQYGATYGHRGDRGNLIFNFSKTEQQEILAGDRAISEFPIAFVPTAAGSAFGRQGIFFSNDGVEGFGTGIFHMTPGAETPGLAPGERTIDDFSAGTNPFNFAPTNFLLTPSNRMSSFVRGTYDITDDVRFFGQFTYNQRKSVTMIAPVPLTAVPSFGVGPQWNFPISADSVYNPFDADLEFGFRMPGNRTNIQDFDTYFGTAGLEGDFQFAGRTFAWDVAYSRGESSRSERGENYTNLLHLSQGVGPSFIDPATGQPTCGTPDNPTPVLNGTTCVPVNMMNGVSGLTPEMLNFIQTNLVQEAGSGLTEWQVNLTGDIVELPAGPLAFAVGYERRTNSFFDQPDSTIVAGINSTNFREATSGSQQAEEAYLELAVPLLSDLPGAQYLELNLAGRTSDFTNEGLVGSQAISESFDNDSFKIGLLYRPYEDLMFRANYSETFRAPSVNNLFGGGGEGFPNATDPCTNNPDLGDPYNTILDDAGRALCHSQGVPVGGAGQPTSQLRGLFGGNPFLQPEEGETKTIGMVFNPSFIEGFDLSVDYWDVELEDGLAQRSANQILGGCFVDGDIQDCSFIDRSAAGGITAVRVGLFNLASINIKGYDISSNYRFDTDNAGRFTVGVDGTYTSKAKVTTGPLSEADDVAGDALGAFQGPTWSWRANAALNWQYGDFGVRYSMRYLSGLTEPCVVGTTNFGNFFPNGQSTRPLCSNPDFDNPTDGYNSVGSVTYHDIAFSYETPWNSTVRAGVRNLFEKDPPFMVTPFANSFDQAYDIPGSFWWLSYQQRF